MTLGVSGSTSLTVLQSQDCRATPQTRSEAPQLPAPAGHPAAGLEGAPGGLQDEHAHPGGVLAAGAAHAAEERQAVGRAGGTPADDRPLCGHTRRLPLIKTHQGGWLMEYKCYST